MATPVTQYETTTMGSESATGNSNNLYNKDMQKTVSNDNYANGMGIAHPSPLKEMENIPGSGASEQFMMKNREIARFNELQSKAFGNPTINNAGVVLDGFGGAFGEAQTSPTKPDVQGGTSK